jgi:hypothetical protein
MASIGPGNISGVQSWRTKIAKGFVASAVSSGVIEEPSMPGHVNAIGNGRVAQTRDALELSKLSLELNQLQAGVLSPDELRAKKQHEREASSS